MYIKFEIHIFVPPPILIYIFSPPKIYYNEWLRSVPQAKNVQPFFKILYILSQSGKKYAYFLPIGEKYAFSSFFIPLQ